MFTWKAHVIVVVSTCVTQYSMGGMGWKIGGVARRWSDSAGSGITRIPRWRRSRCSTIGIHEIKTHCTSVSSPRDNGPIDRCRETGPASSNNNRNCNYRIARCVLDSGKLSDAWELIRFPASKAGVKFNYFCYSNIAARPAILSQSLKCRLRLGYRYSTHAWENTVRCTHIFSVLEM